MSMTDPIADMLTRVRNAQKASHELVNIPSSKLKINVAKVLKSEGFIKNFRIISDGQHRFIKIFLKYDKEGVAIIEGIKRVSKPGCRVYAGSDEVPKVLNGYGINILSTSKGLMTDNEARKTGIGGEILCAVW
ncbi:MAG: 30S ribosomal protein S8 [Desulfobacteraceae bacterium]|jgi:small subunit ribosomal protein S8|nr:30S ribosomal protein S8 [Desulfobacteraceae bacterium]